jgi:5-methylcytosine-specific restriction protein A
MPKHRQPKEVWQVTRERVWLRDSGLCFHCSDLLALDVCHIDHIRSGKLGTNEDVNLRVLCRRCHVLRADNRHRGMIAKALELGIIPPNWRELVWEG